jgi:hypothetical protein
MQNETSEQKQYTRIIESGEKFTATSTQSRRIIQIEIIENTHGVVRFLSNGIERRAILRMWNNIEFVVFFEKSREFVFSL